MSKRATASKSANLDDGGAPRSSSIDDDTSSGPILDTGLRDDPLEALQNQIAYRFRNRQLLEQALTHSSLAYEGHSQRTPQDDNEQLEFLGDAVLGVAVTEHLYRTYPDLGEGTLTQLRAQFVSRKYLGHIARTLSIGEAMKLGKGEERNGGRRKAAILSNALEALIAAIYLDGGLEPAAEFVRRWLLGGTLEALVDASRSGLAVGDHKSALQEYFQARGLGQARYVVTSESGPDHHKTFVVALQLLQPDGKLRQLAGASGSRKKDAEQEAARLALEVLQPISADAPIALDESESQPIPNGTHPTQDEPA